MVNVIVKFADDVNLYERMLTFALALLPIVIVVIDYIRIRKTDK